LKILAINSARAIWLAPTVLLNPQGRYLLPVFADFSSRYKISKVPESKDISVSPHNLHFRDGEFTDAEGRSIYVGMSVHDDGLVAETRASTAEADRFMEEALTWFAKKHGFPHFSELQFKKLYVSELVVELNLSSNLFSDEALSFLSRLKGVAGNSIDLSALIFAPDPTVSKNTAPFRIERLANSGFKDNRYLCTAPVPTSEHVNLLKLLGKVEE
jgi:hypothetical protein